MKQRCGLCLEWSSSRRGWLCEDCLAWMQALWQRQRTLAVRILMRAWHRLEDWQ